MHHFEPRPTPDRRRARFLTAAAAAATATAAALVLLPHPAAAQTTTSWQGTTGDWFTAANWTNGVPAPLGTALVDGGGAPEISSGATAVVDQLRIGNASDQQGGVTLSAGTLSAYSEYLGYFGSNTKATFTQTGGTNRPTQAVYIGYAGPSVGTYALQSGTLAGGSVYVGYRGTGSLVQSGGDLTGYLNLGSPYILPPLGTGYYTLTGGTLSSPVVTVSAPASTFLQTGGTLAVGRVNQSAGLVQVPSLTVGTAQNTPLYLLSGGTLAATSVTVQTGGIFSLSSTGLLACSTFSVTGGTASFPTAVLDSGSPVLPIPTPSGVAQPTLNVTGGTLSATNAYLGNAAGNYSLTQGAAPLPFAISNLYVGSAASSTATYNHSDGTNSLTNLTLGNSATSTGYYNLTGAAATLAVSGTETLGATGAGTLTQAAGTHTAGTLTLGGKGTLNLQGGSLSVDTFNYAAGSRFTRSGGTFSFTRFNQSGGTLAAGAPGSPLPDPLVLGTGGAGASYSLTGGTLTASTITVNPGGSYTYAGGTLGVTTFNLNGGSASFPTINLDSGAPVIPVTSPAGSPAPTFNITSGTLYGTNVTLGATPGSPTFTQSTPVTLRAGTFSIGSDEGANPTYVLPDGQSLHADYTHLGGTYNHATFLQTGGTLAGGYLTINRGGTYVQTGGTNSSAILVAGGTYLQSGGDNAYGSANSLRVGDSTNFFSVSTYTITGGSILTYGDLTVAYNAGAVFNQSGGSVGGTTLYIGYGSGPTGIYNLTGGSMTFSGVGLYRGALNVSNDTATLGGLFNNATLSLAGPDAADSLLPGNLSLAANYTQTSTGALLIGIGGPTPASGYAIVDAGGTATLGGSLTVSLTDGFIPAPGDTFDILTAASVSGAFAHVTLPPNLTLSYTPTAVTLTAIPEPAALAAAPVAVSLLAARRRRRGGRRGRAR